MDTHRCIHRNAASRLSSDDRFDRILEPLIGKQHLRFESRCIWRRQGHRVGRKSTASVSVVQLTKRLVKISGPRLDLSGTSWSQSSGQVSELVRSLHRFTVSQTDLEQFPHQCLQLVSPILEANIDDGGWQTYPLEGYTNLDQVGQSVQFRFQSSGSSYSVDTFSVETVRSIQRVVFDSILEQMVFPIGAMMEPMLEVMECRTALPMVTFAKR